MVKVVACQGAVHEGDIAFALACEPAQCCPPSSSTCSLTISQNKGLSHTDVNNLERAALALDELHGRGIRPAVAAGALSSGASQAAAEPRTPATAAGAAPTTLPTPPNTTASVQEGAAAQQTGGAKAEKKKRKHSDAALPDAPVTASATDLQPVPAPSAAGEAKPKSKKKSKQRVKEG